LASSVVTSLTRPSSVSGKPWLLANSPACRRASATTLASVTGTRNIMSSPARDGDPRALSRYGMDGELVREAFCSTQAQTETRAAREAILHGALDIGNPWAFVLESEAQA